MPKYVIFPTRIQKSKEEGKIQESIQSSTTTDQTPYVKVTKTQGNNTYKRVKR